MINKDNLTIGYACINEELKAKHKGAFKTITVKRASQMDKTQLIHHVKSLSVLC